MPATQWETKLIALIRTLKGPGQPRSFRTEYGEIVSTAASVQAIAPETVEYLLRVRDAVEEWVSKADVNPTESWAKARAIYVQGNTLLPPPLMEAIFAKIPKGEVRQEDRRAAILSQRDRQWLAILVKRRAVRLSDLTKAGKEQPEEFYQSVGLDVLLDLGSQAPPGVWVGLRKGLPRGPGLLSGEQAFAKSFEANPTREVVAWAIDFLVGQPDHGGSLISALFRSPKAAYSLSRGMTEVGAHRARKKSPGAAATIQPLLAHWLATAMAMVEAGHPRVATAFLVLDEFRLASEAQPGIAAAIAMSSIGPQVAALAERRAALALASLELKPDSLGHETMLVLQPAELYKAVQGYLRALPVAGDDGVDSGERAIRLARHKGQKDVLLGVLAALDEEGIAGDLRERLEVALYNLGVRPIGRSGDTVVVDSRFHELDAPGLEPGGAAAVSKSGWCLEGMANPFVLVKARVKPLGSA